MRRTLLGLALLSVLALACGTTASTQRQFDDALVAERVREALRNDADLGRYHVTANVSQGEVTLTGVVGTPADVAKATRIAETVPGVSRVENLLTAGR